MKILCPIDKIEEALPLIKAGADEFFCGVIIDGENLGSIRTTENRKYEYNVSSLEELAAIIKILKSNRRKIYLVFNSSNTNNAKIQIIKSAADKIKELDVDGVILNDLRLVDIFKKAKIKMIAGSFLTIKNENSVRYFKSLGFKRIIFGRQISGELEIIKKIPDLEYEVMIMYSTCRSMEEYCTIDCGYYKKPAGDQNSIIHICSGIYAVGENNKKPSELSPKRLKRSSIGCGCCAIYEFKKYGITSLKIVGRGYPLKRKLQAVKFVKACVELLKKSKNKQSYINKTRKLFKKTFNKECRCEECCYSHLSK